MNILQNLKFGVSKVQDFGKYELSPMGLLTLITVWQRLFLLGKLGMLYILPVQYLRGSELAKLSKEEILLESFIMQTLILFYFRECIFKSTRAGVTMEFTFRYLRRRRGSCRC